MNSQAETEAPVIENSAAGQPEPSESQVLTEWLAEISWSQADFRARGLPAKYHRASLVGFRELGGSEAVVEQLVNWLNAGARRWLYLYGPAGVGKSSLAAAVACLLIAEDRQPHFWPVMRLMDRVRKLIGKGGSQGEILEAVANLDVLILDDLGRELGTDWALERMRLLIGERYDNERLTIITSNLSLSQIGKVDEPMAWRIRELSEVVHIPGPNLRAATVRKQEPKPGGAE